MSVAKLTLFLYLRDMRKLPILFLTLLLLTVSCHPGGKELAARLRLADSLIEAEPDSGMALLMSLKEEAEDASKANRYRYQLLLAKAMNKTYRPITTDSLLREAASYYDDHGSANERMEAHYLLGCAYRDMDSLSMALLEYEEAINQADTNSEDCDFKTLGRVYGQAADVLQEFKQPRDLLEYSRLSGMFARKAKDTAMVISSCESMADAYDMLNKPDSQIIFSRIAAQKYLDYGDKQGAAMALGPVIEIYVARKEWAKAKQCMDIYDQESGVFLPNGDIEPGREIYYFSKGQYYMGKSQLDSANYYFRKLQAKPNPSLNERTAAAQGLYNFYKDIGDKDSTLKYCEQATILVDSGLGLCMDMGTTRVNAIYKYGKAQEEAKQKELENTRMHYLLWGGGIFFLLAIAISVLIYKWKLHEQRLKTEHNQGLLALARESLAQAKEDMRMLQAKTEDEKQQFMRQKEAQIAQLQARIHQLNTPQEHADVERKIGNAPITERLHLLAHKAKELPTQQDWHELSDMMDKEMPSFRATLEQTTSLYGDEYCICVLIRLRFRLSEICYLTNTSKSNLTNKRKRLLKKITGKDGTASDFDRFLLGIY